MSRSRVLPATLTGTAAAQIRLSSAISGWEYRGIASGSTK